MPLRHFIPDDTVGEVFLRRLWVSTGNRVSAGVHDVDASPRHEVNRNLSTGAVYTRVRGRGTCLVRYLTPGATNRDPFTVCTVPFVRTRVRVTDDTVTGLSTCPGRYCGSLHTKQVTMETPSLF